MDNKSLFQPTRPVRGVTQYLSTKEQFTAVSTHTPRAGRDYLPILLYLIYIQFQPTRPVRGVTLMIVGIIFLLQFQPTRPVRGVTWFTIF